MLVLCTRIVTTYGGEFSSTGMGIGSNGATDRTMAAPAIANRPASLSINVGTAARFLVSATGGGTLGDDSRKSGIVIGCATAVTTSSRPLPASASAAKTS